MADTWFLYPIRLLLFYFLKLIRHKLHKLLQFAMNYKKVQNLEF